MRRRPIVASLGALTVAAGLWAVVSANADRRAIVDEVPVSLAGESVSLVFEGTTLKNTGRSEQFGSTSDSWLVRVDQVVWTWGDRPYAGSADFVFDWPDEGEAIEVTVDRGFEIAEAERYSFAVERAFFEDPARQAEWPFQALVIADIAGRSLVAGVPDVYRDELERAARPGESLVETLVGVAADASAYTVARTRDPATAVPGPYLAALMKSDESVDEAERSLQILLSRPPDERQLPMQLVDLPEDAAARLDIGAWRYVRVLVLGVPDDFEWIGVRFSGKGFLGPFAASAQAPFVEIDGYGPPGGTVQLISWSGGTPAEIIYRPESFEDTLVSAEPVGERLVVPTPVGSGGTLAVLAEFRADGVALTQTTEVELDALIDDLVPDSTGRSELEDG